MNCFTHGDCCICISFAFGKSGSIQLFLGGCIFFAQCPYICTPLKGSGGSSARLEYLVWDQGVAGSNPVLPTNRKKEPLDHGSFLLHQRVEYWWGCRLMFFGHHLFRLYACSPHSAPLAGGALLRATASIRQLFNN